MSELAKMAAWVAVLMSYARFASAAVSPGSRRLLSLLPVICVFPFLPFYCASIVLRGTSALFLSWLAVFKLLLLAFGCGPLHPSLPLRVFIATASLPVKLRATSPMNPGRPSSGDGLLARIVVKASLFILLLPLHRYKSRMPAAALLALYSLYIYLGLDVILATAAAAVQALLGKTVELEPQSDAPYLSTSLQDFWGRRWNLMVPSVLRPAVYLPVRRRWGPTAGVLTTFLVSGLMHEAMFFYLTGAGPTGGVTGFFLLHGAFLAAEIGAKRAAGPGGARVPPAVSTPATLGFLMATGYWLFFPLILRTGTDDRMVGEFLAALGTLGDSGRWIASWIPVTSVR